jgi:3-oxoacyl-ACP reductase-like protein
VGLFDRKIKRPTDLDDEPEPAVPEPAPAKPSPASASAPAPVAAAKPAAAPAVTKPDHPDYGINKAIELMRLLPEDNIELIVRVVKTTLESTNINVATIVHDATRKQAQIEARVGVLKNEIALLETDHKETTSVKDRLVLAEKLSAGREEPRAPFVAPRPATPTGIPIPRSDPTPRS